MYISKLSWECIDKFEDVIKEGEVIKVKIEKINFENGKILFFYCDMVVYFWEGVEERFFVDIIYKGIVICLV